MIISRCSTARGSGSLSCSITPSQENRREWRTTMLTEVVAASDRNDSRAREWAMCVMDDSISHEQLARVPPGFEKLDRNFTKALKKCFDPNSVAHRQVVQEET